MSIILSRFRRIKIKEKIILFFTNSFLPMRISFIIRDVYFTYYWLFIVRCSLFPWIERMFKHSTFRLLVLFDQQTTTHFDVDTTIPCFPQTISCLLLCWCLLVVYRNNYYSFHTEKLCKSRVIKTNNVPNIYILEKYSKSFWRRIIGWIR